jgi:hypothetical protein
MTKVPGAQRKLLQACNDEVGSIPV